MTEKKQNINNKTNFIRSIIDGTFLSKELILKNIGFISLLFFLALIYIINRYYAENLVRETIKLQKEVEELKSEQLFVTSTLMKLSQQSEVESLMIIHNLDLKSSDIPPYKITIECQK
jgi:hypothetical protein